MSKLVAVQGFETIAVRHVRIFSAILDMMTT